MKRWTLWAVLSALIAIYPARQILAAERDGAHPWNLGLKIGKIDTEGNEQVDDAYTASLLLGYNFTEALSLEGALTLIPELRGNYYDDFSTGCKVKHNRLYDATGKNETWALGASADALYHFAPRKTVDPFLSVGYGVIKYDDDVGSNDGWEITPQIGAGLFYKLTEALALRADLRYFLTGTPQKSYSNSKFEIGLNWNIGASARVRHDTMLDTAVRETPVETVKLAPPPAPVELDTDKDGLTDAEETGRYRTDPLNPDTDWDGLSDGDEVKIHKTDPLKRDTDAGGVADGHEVIEDKTNPLQKPDDLELYILHIEFDEGSAKLTAQYFEQLDVIGKIMKEAPEATARIEGHADRRKASSERQAKKLTQKRAEAVRDYLAGNKWNIARARLTAAGYGFSRPVEKPDLEKGNLANRRIEIYIRTTAGKK